MSEKNIINNCCGQRSQWEEKMSACCNSNTKSIPSCCDNSNNQTKEE